MNKAILIGRLTKDPELKFTTGSGIAVATFTLAVDRPYVGQSGQKEADFIPIVCWRKLAENVANNLQKGKLVAVSGAIQTRKYQAQDGTNRYVTEIVADSVQFLEWSKDGSSSNKGGDSSQGFGNKESDTGFMPVEDDDIPF